MSLHHAAPARASLAPSQTGPAVQSAAAGGTGFAIVLREAARTAPEKPAATHFALPSPNPGDAAGPGGLKSEAVPINGAPTAATTGHAAKRGAVSLAADATTATLPDANITVFLGAAPAATSNITADVPIDLAELQAKAGWRLNAHGGEPSWTAHLSSDGTGPAMVAALALEATGLSQLTLAGRVTPGGQAGIQTTPGAAPASRAATASTIKSGPAQAANAQGGLAQAASSPPMPRIVIGTEKLSTATGAASSLQTHADGPAEPPAWAQAMKSSSLAPASPRARTTVASGAVASAAVGMVLAPTILPLRQARQTPAEPSAAVAAGDGDGAAPEPAQAQPRAALTQGQPEAAATQGGTSRKEAASTLGRQAEAAKNAVANAQDMAALQAGQAAPATAAAAPDGSGATAAQPNVEIGKITGPAASEAANAAQSSPQASAPGTSAVQVAQGLSAMHLTGAGARLITIHLTPGTLGAVQVRIERGADGAATITLQAEKAETLHALQQDSAHLHEALDRAGLPSAGRQVSYELAQNQADAAHAPGHDAGHEAGHEAGQFGNQSGAQGGGAGSNSHRGQPGQPPTPAYARADTDTFERTTTTQGRGPATAASAINITA